MNKAFFILAAVTLVTSALTGCGERGKTVLNISAAGSLVDAITEINKLYVQQNEHVLIYNNFSSSGDLQTQIEQGAPADVFISAAPRQMNTLQDKGLILPDTRRDLLTNSVALIVPAASTIALENFGDLTHESVKRIAIGDPAFVPAGSYGKMALDLLGIYESVAGKFIIAGNVMQVRAYVESGEADAGILFLTDAVLSDRVRVAATAPSEINQQIAYPAAVVKASKNTQAAAEYIDFLSSAPAKSIFEKYGFTVIS